MSPLCPRPCPTPPVILTASSPLLLSRTATSPRCTYPEARTGALRLWFTLLRLTAPTLTPDLLSKAVAAQSPLFEGLYAHTGERTRGVVLSFFSQLLLRHKALLPEAYKARVLTPGGVASSSAMLCALVTFYRDHMAEEFVASGVQRDMVDLYVKEVLVSRTIYIGVMSTCILHIWGPTSSPVMHPAAVPSPSSLPSSSPPR